MWRRKGDPENTCTSQFVTSLRIPSLSLQLKRVISPVFHTGRKPGQPGFLGAKKNQIQARERDPGKAELFIPSHTPPYGDQKAQEGVSAR